jgi:hypothetical protein
MWVLLLLLLLLQIKHAETSADVVFDTPKEGREGGRESEFVYIAVCLLLHVCSLLLVVFHYSVSDVSEVHNLFSVSAKYSSHLLFFSRNSLSHTPALGCFLRDSW